MITTILNLVGLAAASAISVNVVPTPQIRPTRSNAPPCLPAGRSTGARIVGLGVYEGRGHSPFVSAKGSHATSSIAVSGARKGAPVILVLSAYEPVVWDLQNFPEARLRAVLVFGYHGQAVAGAPRNLLVRFSTTEGGNGNCGPALSAYKGGSDLEALDGSLRSVLNRGLDDFQGSYGAAAFDIDHGPVVQPSLGALHITDLRTSGLFEVARPDGADGIRKLLTDGTLRIASKDDVQALDAALTRASSTGHLAPVHAELRGPIYVVRRPFVVPKDMYGAHSVTFLVPAGVAFPVDKGSHNTYFSLADGSSKGPGRR